MSDEQNDNNVIHMERIRKMRLTIPKPKGSKNPGARIGRGYSNYRKWLAIARREKKWPKDCSG